VPRAIFNYQLYETIPQGYVEVEGAQAYRGPLIVANATSISVDIISIGISFANEGCDLDVLRAADEIRSIEGHDNFIDVLSTVNSVRDSFKRLVSDLHILLQEAKQSLTREEVRVNDVAQSENHRQRLQERAISFAVSMYAPELQTLFARCHQVVQDMSAEEDATHKKYFRLCLHPLVKGSPFVDRGFAKPLGYSGDYGMMVMLYEYADLGATLFHKFFHRFVCSEPAAVANRNRVEFLSGILNAAYIAAAKRGDPGFKIASLACGPAREIYEFLRFAPLSDKCPVEIVLVDTEEFALDYAQSRLKELGISPTIAKLMFLKEDVVAGAIQKKDFLKRMQSATFIISAGLFDYLTDRVSRRVIASLYPLLANEGQLLIGNIARSSPNVFAMDYFMDWRLILRDEPDLLQLVDNKLEKGIIKADVIAEETGLNLFLRLTKGALESEPSMKAASATGHV